MTRSQVHNRSYTVSYRDGAVQAPQPTSMAEARQIRYDLVDEVKWALEDFNSRLEGLRGLDNQSGLDLNDSRGVVVTLSGQGEASDDVAMHYDPTAAGTPLEGLLSLETSHSRFERTEKGWMYEEPGLRLTHNGNGTLTMEW